MRNLFLAPGSKENIEDSIKRPVPLHILKKYLSESSFNRLQIEAQGEEKFNCFAMKSGSQSFFEVMKPTDIVIFKPNQTSQFQYKGIVMYKVNCLGLGREIWKVGENWELIYFVKDIKRININLSLFAKKLGYAENWVPQGISRVDEQ